MEIKSFTTEEKITLLQIMILIMEADSVIHPKEILFINKFMEDYSIDSKAFDHFELIDFDMLKSKFKKMPYNKQENAKQLFLGLAKCDGFTDPRELEVINYL